MAGSWCKRVTYVPQMEGAECGAACLTAVLDHFGCTVPLAELRVACGVTRDGASALQLVRAAQEYGLAVRAVKIDVHELRSLALPAILHWEFNHFVVLERVTRRRARIVDPASGRRWVSSRELDRAFTGVALSFRRGAQFRPVPRRSGSLLRYAAVLRRSLAGVVFVLCAAALLELMSVFSPAAHQLLIDHVLGQQRQRWLAPLVLAMGAAALVQTVISALRGRVLAALGYAIDLGLASSMIDHMLRLPLGFFAQRNTGDLMERMAAVEQLRQIATRAASAVLDGLLVVSYAALLLLCDVRLGSIVLSLSIARLVLLLALGDRTRQLAASEFALRGPEMAAAVEGLCAPEMVKACHAEALLGERYTQRLFARTTASFSLGSFGAAQQGLAGTCDVLIGAAALWLGGNAVIDDSMTLGTLVCAMTACALLQAAFGSLAELISSLMYASGMVNRIDDVMNSPAESDAGEHPGELRGEIELCDLGFQHGPSAPWVFRGLHAHIKPGEKIAIVGRSGSGKSTLSRLLTGLLEPSEGAVRVDGRDLRTLRARDVRAQLGVVLQEPFVLDDSVRANLLLFRPEASSEEMRQAAALACIADDIDALPDEYDTPIGPTGHGLSRGQLQRLCLARALLARPRILVLDEATSSLDLATEARLHDNLRALCCTRVVIAHRLKTVVDADRILVLDNGGFVQQGSYAELCATPGPFQLMVHGLV